MSVNLRSSRGNQMRLKRELVYGTTPAGSFLHLNANTIDPQQMPVMNPFTPQGAFFPTITVKDDNSTEGDIEGVVDFNSIVFLLASLLGYPVIANLAAGAWSHTFSTGGRTPNRAVSYTMHHGHPDAADVVTGWVFNTLGLSGGRSDGFSISSSGFGKPTTRGQQLGGTTNEVQTISISGSPTGGTFTLTFESHTTAGIAYNASAAAVEDALELLPTIGVGNITCAGGPLPGTAVPATFVGDLAGKNVSLMTANSSGLTGGTTPTATVAETTPGADVVVDIAAVPAGAMIGDAYVDTSWATRGTTQLLYLFNSDLQIGERMGRVRPTNRSLSSDSIIDNPDQEHTLALTLAVNAVERARLTALEAGTKEFVRLTWTGGQIASSGFNYLLRVDAAVLWTEVGPTTDFEGVSTREVTGRISLDTTANEALTIFVQNAQSTLSP